jgi:hypothetical protein
MDAAIATAASYEPAARILLTHGLHPGFMAPAAEAMVVATIAGARLGCTDEELHHLALAAFFADVGMLLVPKLLWAKPGRLNDRERRQVERHTVLGAAALRELGSGFPLVPRVARDHHERFDGGGYPAGLRGARVVAEAQIVSLAQLYVGLTRGRCYRPGVPPQQAISVLGQRACGVAEPTVLRAFLGSIEPYPPGSLVRLSDGRIGRIRERDEIRGPVVEILWDDTGEIVPSSLISLGDHPGMTVSAVSCVDDPLQPHSPNGDEHWVRRALGKIERQRQNEERVPDGPRRQPARMATRRRVSHLHAR